MASRDDATNTAPDALTGDHLDNLAGQALENLVNQFARPLDFLRELVQNSIDAGSPRVEVRIGFEPDEGAAGGTDTGVLEVHVDDWGEGMDERIIDSQLTRLFASSKEDDLTKIGKFGIGFTSIFAIRPDAVLLRTGRHGEHWELLFHADRSFDKVRIDEPVAGTQITLFKRMPAAEVEQFVRESRWILHFWCEHSDTPITFFDQTRPQEEAAPAAADPFAAFEDGALEGAAGVDASPATAVAGPEPVNSPMKLDADLQVEGEVQGVRVVVGYAPRPRYGFYNGGLTLMNTENDDVLGEHRHRLGHLSFKVKSDALEHTLTRDNVLQDANWTRAIDALRTVSEQLQARLVERTTEAVQAGEPLSKWHGYLADECRRRALHRTVEGARDLPLLRDHDGAPLSLTQLEAEYDRHGAVLLFPGEGGLARALAAEKIRLFDDDPDLRALLVATWRAPFLSLSDQGRQILRADRLFLLPDIADPAILDRAEARLLSDTRALLSESVTGRLSLDLASFPAGAREALVVEGPEGSGVFRRAGRRWTWLPSFAHRRRLLLNRGHAYYLSQRVLAGEQPTVAAFALAQAILSVEGLEGEQSFLRLDHAVGQRVSP